MKKRNIPKIYAGVTAGMMISAAALLSGCNEKVYGPPPDLELEDDSGMIEPAEEHKGAVSFVLPETI